MQFLLDHLVATLTVGILIFLVAALTLGRAEGARDSTRTYALNAAQHNMTTVLERDLMDAGIGTPEGSTPIQTLTPTVFAFYGVTDPSGATGLIEYREVTDGVVDGVPAIRVERYVDGALTGASAWAMVRFDVVATDDEGAVVGPGTLDRARILRVEAEWATAHNESGAGLARQNLRRSGWGTAVRPLGLDP